MQTQSLHTRSFTSSWNLGFGLGRDCDMDLEDLTTI